MNCLGIIPARYASTRFPGKPLVDINGKSMIRRVYEQASKALQIVYVATDDKRIFQHVTDFGGKAVMTSSLHPSGTDRCNEAMSHIERETGMTFDVIVNIQGDEPFIDPEQINLLVNCFQDSQAEIATLVKPIENDSDLWDPNKPKVVLSTTGMALLFSRSPIPYVRNAEKSDWLTTATFYMHLGIYGYRSSVLQSITKLEPSLLEKAESLEQLRWLENGYRIKAAITNFSSLSVDTPDDLKKILD